MKIHFHLQKHFAMQGHVFTHRGHGEMWQLKYWHFMLSLCPEWGGCAGEKAAYRQSPAEDLGS